MLTQAQKDLWLARLRDPNTKQQIGSGCPNSSEYLTDQEIPFGIPMCCLVHGQQAIEGHSFIFGTNVTGYWNWAEKAVGKEISVKLYEMNDSGKFTLLEIADWIEANVPVQS